MATAQAAVEVLQAGAPDEQIAAAQALVDQSEASIQALLARRDQARIAAPGAGTVTSVVRHAGEVAAAGAPIVRLADLSEVTLKVYVPEAQLGQVRLGETAQVTVDSLPDRPFAGRVTYIGDSAEFTPKNVQTYEDRIKLVFPVEITVANPERCAEAGHARGRELRGHGDTGRGGHGEYPRVTPSPHLRVTIFRHHRGDRDLRRRRAGRPGRGRQRGRGG